MQSTNIDTELAIRLRVALPNEIDELVDIDDDAAALFVEAGLDFSGPTIAAFGVAERARWLAAAEQGRVELALDDAQRVLGFVALGLVDGQPYLDQLSQRLALPDPGQRIAMVRARVLRPNESSRGAESEKAGQIKLG